ncbi:MAG: hypothetical protein PHC38_04235 [Weeksellaceae bacterium]|nr:hypothetical protein [Weeksellaceae bacterium]
MSQKNAPIMPPGYHIGLNVLLNIFVGTYYLYVAIENFNKGIYANPYYDPTTFSGAIGNITGTLFTGFIPPLLIALIVMIFKRSLFLNTFITSLYITQILLIIVLVSSIS